MFEKSTTTKLALITILAVLFALSATPATFAHSDNQTTSTTCSSSESPCNVASVTSVTDTVWLCVSIDSPTECSPTGPSVASLSTTACPEPSNGWDGNSKDLATENLGTLCFHVYQAPNGCTGTLGAQVTSGVVPTKTTIPGTANDEGALEYTSTLSLSSSTTPVGEYAWVVQFQPYSGHGSDFPPLQTCETFFLTGTFPPTPTVPQFPLGMTVLLALAIPALLVMRSKFASKQSPSILTV